MACQCAQNWRVLLVSLTTGETGDTIVPESFEFSTGFMEPGRGSVTFKMQGVINPLATRSAGSSISANSTIIQNFYSGDYGVIFSRVAGGSASWENPKHMFVGIIDTPRINSDGTVTLGLVEITDYLDSRVLRDSHTFTLTDQRLIASSLVTYIAEGTFTTGGPVEDDEWVANTNARIFGDRGMSGAASNRNRTYVATDRPVDGELIRQLTGLKNGPVYRVEPEVNIATGVWSFVIKFYNQGEFEALFTTPTITWDDVVDAELLLARRDRADLVEVFGAQPDKGQQQIVTRRLNDASVELDTARPLSVRYDATVTYDSNTTSVLENFGDGEVLRRFDAAGVLSLDFAGVEYGTGPASTLTLDDINPGQPVNVVLRDRELPWEFVAGPDIVNVDSPFVLSVDDLAFGQVSVSAPAEGPEQVNAQVTTSKPFLTLFGATI